MGNGGDEIGGGDDDGGGSSERTGARERHGMMGSKQIDVTPAIANRPSVGASHARGRLGDYLKQAGKREPGRGDRARKGKG